MLGSRDVAIVGMACIEPGAPDVETFWANVVDGVDSVTEVPSSRWDLDAHFDPTYDSSRRKPDEEPKSISKWGGFVPDVGFDALAWGIPPASLASVDMAQLMALKAAADALEDAGLGPGGPRADFDRERASVIYATGSGGASDLPAGYIMRLLLANHGVHQNDLPPELHAFLPELTEDGLPGVLTSVIAGRVANRLDLGGKNLTVDSACASVLVALDIARNELLGGSSDVVLCGGVDLHNGAQDYVSFTAAQALARSGRCRSFDADGDGMTLAEGCGCLVLKRLEDASREGDRIYAVIRGVAGSSDGRSLGLTAPRQEGQERAVRRAYADAGLSPAEIGLVEAHGTGTVAGDRTELLTTTAVFTEAGAAPGSIVLGSVKSNIGHTKCASAIAALIKAAKATYHGVLPPTLHINRPNDVWDPETSPFVFRDRARPWLDDRRLVGVSSFGFGGTNFHTILENHRPTASLPPAAPVTSVGATSGPPASTPAPSAPVTGSATTSPAPATGVGATSGAPASPEAATHVVASISPGSAPATSETELAAAAPGPAPAAPATATDTPPDAPTSPHPPPEPATGLGAPASPQSPAVPATGSATTAPAAVTGLDTASVVPASGRPHWPAELIVFRGSPPDVSTRLDALAERLAEELVPPVQADRWRLRDVAAHESAFGSGLPADHLAPVRVAIVASDLADLAAKVDAARSGTAMAGVYRAIAPEPGEDDDAGEIAESGADRAPDGSPAGVPERGEDDDAGEIAEPGTSRAADAPAGAPGPGEGDEGREVAESGDYRITGSGVDGEDDEVAEVVFLVPGVGAAVRPGMVGDVLVAFPELREHVLAPDEIEPGVVDVMLPAQAFDDEGRARQQAALDQVATTALTLAQRTLAGAIERFGVVPDHVVVDDTGDGSDVAAAVRRLADGGATVFVEVGPGTALTDLVDRTLGDQPHVAVPTDRPGEHGVTTLLHALARLAVAGVPVDVAALHAGRGARPERWADPPRKPGWIINGHFARTAGGASLPKGLRPATEAPPFHIAGGPAPAEPAATTGGGGHANGNGNGGLSTEQTAVIMEYLRIVQGVIATGSRIVQGHAQAAAAAETPTGPVR